MQIPNGTYNRIENMAGGCWASDRDFIRAFRSKLTREAKTRDARDRRHALIVSMFKKRERARELACWANGRV